MLKNTAVLKNNTWSEEHGRFSRSRRWLQRFCCGLLFCCPVWALAQIPDSARATPPPAAARPPRPTLPDTLTPVTYVLAQAPERSFPFADTMPGQAFRFYDPARRATPDYATLGNLGTPARPLWFDTPARRGFDVGEHVFDLYRATADDLRFYENARSFSEVYFSQGPDQENAMFNAQLARTFSGGSTFAFDYRNINNLGQFRYQRAKHTGMSIGLRAPVGERYEGFLIYNQNIFRQWDNGGIVTDTVFGNDQFGGAIDAEVRLPGEAARTRISDWSLQLTQHLKFAGKEPGKRVFRASHTLNWTRGFWKFYDDDLANDAGFFDPSFITDGRGLRNFIQTGRVDNRFILSTFKQKKTGRPSDVLGVGLAHSWFDLYQEPLDTAFSNLFLTGNLGISPSEQFNLSARGDLGMLANFGEYHVSGELTLGLGKAGRLRAAVLSQRRPVPLLYRQAFVSFRPVWQNDFAKPVETSLSATYELPLAGFSATGRTHLVNNYLYFDQNGRPAQTGTALQVGQLMITENLRLGAWHFDNTVGIQQINRGDVLRLPTWFSENSAYFSGKVFKKRMDLQAGVDFRINSAFRPDAYQPLFWQFHLQDSLTQQPYPWLDVFVAFKVRTFRFYIRYENVQAIWSPETVFYQTAYHPQPFNAIRFGISWRFMDANVEDTKKNPSGGDSPPSGPIGPRGF